MEEFLSKTVSNESKVVDENGDVVVVRASRTRTSEGFRGISIEFGKQRIDFNIGDDYEQHAQLVIDLLGSVVDNPCALPSDE